MSSYPPSSREGHGMEHLSTSPARRGMAVADDLAASASSAVVDIDLDATLPLPEDASCKYDAIDDFEMGCRLLLGVLSSPHPLSEDDAASLLSRLTRLRVGHDDNEDDDAPSRRMSSPSWSATSSQLVRATVKAAMHCLGGGNGERDDTSTASSSTSCIVDGRMARRLLTDGILPLASCSYPPPRSPSHSYSSSHDATPPPWVWIAKLIRSIVVEDLLPSVLRPDRGENIDDDDDGDPTAVSVLLSTFLTRMDTDESSTILPPDPTPADVGGVVVHAATVSVDDVLDRLCGVGVIGADGGGTRVRKHLRPSVAAAVLAALREFESSNVDFAVGVGVGGARRGGGRLSFRRIWTGGREGGEEVREDEEERWMPRGECRYEYVDRHTSLLRSGLRSLRSIVVGGRVSSGSRSSSRSSRRAGGADYFDSLPPLVYQLGLLPMGATSSSSGGGQESDRHRGMRLRLMCLEGIADSLEDDDQNDNGRCEDGDRAVSRDDNVDGRGDKSKTSRGGVERVEGLRREEAYRWARYTSLAHLGNCLRSDPELCHALLSMLAGEISILDDEDEDDDTTNDEIENIRRLRQRRFWPFRFARLTPFRLAMGLSMASSVPRTRTAALSAIRDLVLEEETLRVRCGERTGALDQVLFGGKRNTSVAVSGGRPWMNCLIRCLEMNVVGKKCDGRDGGDGGDGDGGDHAFGSEGDNGIPIVLRCLFSVAQFAESENAMTLGGGAMMACGGGGGCASSILQSLSQLGFLLIDCVKKDEPYDTASISSCGVAVAGNTVAAMRASTVLAPNLDISSFGGNRSDRNGNISSLAPRAVATIGRFLLCYLFYQSSSSRFSSSSLFLSHGRGCDDTALCRSILRTSFDKFTSMAPNAMEHATLLMDLLRFHPSMIGIDDQKHTCGAEDDFGRDDIEQKGMTIALVLTTNYLPSIIETLGGVSGGGMSPIVASRVIPTLGRLMLLMATASSSPSLRRKLVAGSLWKRHDLEDHVNQAFLMAKKCLFVRGNCSGVLEKQKCGVKLLVMLLSVAAVAASSSSPSSYCVSYASSNRANSVWSSILYDIKCCLRRSLTQHQQIVRIEVYSSLLELLPKTVPCHENSNLSPATQDSTSPTSQTAKGSKGMLSPKFSLLRSYNEVVASIPPMEQNALISVVSELLVSSLGRYVTIPKEELTDRKARQKRAALGVGLSQLDVEDELPEGDSKIGRGKCSSATEEKSNPFRFEKLINTRPPGVTNRHGTKKKAKVSVGQTLLMEAMDRIDEPLAFLLASTAAVTPLLDDDECDDGGDDGIHDNNGNSDRNNEMRKTLYRIRSQMARCTDVDEYLKWTKTNKEIFCINDNAQRAKEMALCKLATLILISVISDVLIGMCNWEKEHDDGSNEANEIEDLFTLRTDAMSEAAHIMSSFVMKQKTGKPALKKEARKEMVETKLKNIDVNTSSQSIVPTATEKKKGRKSSSSASVVGDGIAVLTKVKSSDVSETTIAKNRKLIEDVVDNITPAMNHKFLAESLRKTGAQVSKKAVDGADSDEDMDDVDNESGATARLAKCLSFRRYVITKSLLLMSGSSSIVKIGATFCPLPLCNSVGSAVTGGAMDEISTMRIAASLSLGPLLFVEFCTHCYELEQTSIAIASRSSSASMTNISLAQLSLRAFTCCVRGMAFDAPNHSLSTASRVNALLTSSMRKASTSLPCSADGWEHCQQLNNGDLRCANCVPQEEIELLKTLVPILSLPRNTETAKGSSVAHICLFSELLSNCMYGEAMECIYLISSAAESLREPNCRERLGVHLLRGFEVSGADQVVGVLGLGHSDESNDCNPCASAAISVAMKLNCGLDGNTHVPLPGADGLSEDRLRAARSRMGLPMTLIENWPEWHQGRLQKEHMIGIPTQVAWALSATLEIGKHFSVTFDKNSPTKKQLKLAVIKAAAHSSEANFSREKSSIAHTISSVIDGALDNADFVTLKMIPYMPIRGLDLAQRFVSSLLFSVSKMIGAMAPSAEFLVIDGSFSSTLLKNTKRMYTILVKLILSFMTNPESLTSSETKNFLDYVTSTLTRRISALLFTLQEKQETAGGKFLAESKIESHGKASALLVFEKERLDNALLKVASKLKQSGLDEDSEWLESHVVSNLSRDFIITRVDDAKAREAPKTKKKSSRGTKRKVKSEHSKSKKKEKRVDIDERNRSDVDDDDDADEESVIEVDADESTDDDDGDDVVSLSKLTADMVNEEGNSSDGSDEDLDSESEGEAEFDE